MPLTVLANVDHRLVKADTAAVAAIYPVEDFLRIRPLSQPAQLDGQELLERLAAVPGAALQRRVHILGEITDEQVRHAYIMQASVA